MFDEQTILDEIRQGNKNAFNTMFLHFYAPLCEYASLFVSDADAEEIVQDIMLYVWENRKTFTVEKSLKSYLFASVKNRCYNTIRDRQSRERVHLLLYEKLKDYFPLLTFLFA